MECALLGAVLLEGKWITGLQKTLFMSVDAITLFEVLEDQRAKNLGLDLVSVLGKVPRHLMSYAAAAPGKVPSLEAVPTWLRCLKELRHQRALVAWSAEVQEAVALANWEEVARLRKAQPVEEEEQAAPQILPEEAPDMEVRRSIIRLVKRSSSERLQADLVLREDPRWKGRIWCDAFRQIQMLDQRRHADEDDQAIALWMERVYRVKISGAGLAPIISAIAQNNQRDPLVEYLRGLRWDGVERASFWLVDGMGVPDSTMVRTMGRRWLIQAVARALRPGCKADIVLMLVGAQGVKKSSALRTLVGPEFFSDSPILMGDVRGIEQTHAAWVHELAELVGLKKREVEETKAHISAQEDTYRPAYGRKSVTRKRRCVFGATTNEDQPLFDPTGSRRFWIARVEKTDMLWIAQHRDQLWAEAVAAFEAGEAWHLSQEEEAEVNEVRQEFQREEPWEERIAYWLGDSETINEYWVSGYRNERKYITTSTIIDVCLKIPVAQQSSNQSQAVGRMLKALGFRHQKVKVKGRTANVYSPMGVNAE
jgi:hypothetical protein